MADEALDALDVATQVAIFETHDDVQEDYAEEFTTEEYIVSLGKTLASVLFEIARGENETHLSSNGMARACLPGTIALFNKGFSARMRQLENQDNTVYLGSTTQH